VGLVNSCWGSTSPAPTGGVQLSQFQALAMAIISAHDFDIWFCGYRSGDASPHVWEILLNNQLCANTDAQGGYCTLQVIDHGDQSCVPGQGTGLGGTGASCVGPTNSPPGDVV